MTSPEARIGDRERQGVDAQLQAAVADGMLTLTEYDERATALWAARTRRDLLPLTADLPAGHPAVPSSAAAAALSPPPRRVVAVLSEDRLSAPVAPGQPVRATAVLGEVVVDLRRDDLPVELQVRAVAVLGEVKVRVPPGTTVHLTGGAMLGERRVRVGPAHPGGSVLHLQATTVLGSITVDVVDDDDDDDDDDDAVTGPPVPSRSRGLRRRRTSRIVGALGAVVVAGAVGTGVVAAGSVVTAAADGSAVFGSRVVTVGAQDRVEVGVLFGSVKVVLPPGVVARTGGTVIFGSVECPTACAPSAGNRQVSITTRGGFGSIEVVTQAEAGARR